MRVVKPSVRKIEINKTFDGIFRDIERAAEICVASNKIHEDVVGYVNGLIERKHYRPLEFGTVYAKVWFPHGVSHSEEAKTEIEFWDRVIASPWTRVVIDDDKNSLITTNARVVREVYDKMIVSDTHKKHFTNWIQYVEKYWCYTEQHEKRITYLWTISRATADSFRTYILISSLMQSTRYCNYSSNKFGNEVTFVQPNWWEHDWETTEFKDFNEMEKIFLESWNNDEANYLLCLKNGMKAQHARGVLPLDIKTEFIQCAYIDAWKNFFDQRVRNTTGEAHDDAQYIAKIAELL